jgi:hypothetical protein
VSIVTKPHQLSKIITIAALSQLFFQADVATVIIFIACKNSSATKTGYVTNFCITF